MGRGWPLPELPGPPGTFRIATAADHATLADWLRAAAIEAAERLPSPSGMARDLISYGGAVFAEVSQFGEPVPQPAALVALVALTRPVADLVRISMIYTLPERRRNGYAAALTQAVSRALLAETGPATGLLGHGCVREVVMITDKNRSEHWGGRLGYQLIGERAVLRFGPASGPIPRANSTNSLPRLPTGPLPRLPRLRH